MQYSILVKRKRHYWLKSFTVFALQFRRMDVMMKQLKASEWLRQKRGTMSYRELGRLIGLTHTTIANAEDGNATEATWIRLAEYFEESPSKVLAMAGKTLTPNDSDVQDEWVSKTAIKMARLPAESRNLVDHLIQYLIDKERGSK
jgi:DNA-binding XRE family transcriptional regulator